MGKWFKSGSPWACRMTDGAVASEPELVFGSIRHG